ncbi:MAG: hypothetical protein QOE44_390 [Solirubrobacteraceae bacterium]|nr:hypothetical protein [Solirubrobacteraceae bacterium]
MAYTLDFTEDVPTSVRRCIREELATATTLLRDDFEADPVEAVHEARKSLKKTRAALRMVRTGLGKRVYRQENRALRDAARLISGARDADVMVETVEKLADRYVARLPADDFTLRDHLRVQAATSRAAGGAGSGRTEVVGVLDGVAGRIEDWPLEQADWTTVAGGMEVAYRRGRRAFAAVEEDPTVEHLHDWRKRVKDLWYHQRLVSPAWPGVIEAQADEAHRLSELLGDDHDLAVLAGLFADDEAGTRPPVPVDPGPLLGLIAERRAEIQGEAVRLGARIYAERPKAFRRRVRRYLEAARAEAAAGAEDGVRV